MTDAIRVAIADKVRSIPNIGVVHTHERFAKDLQRLKALYFSSPHAQLRGWFVRLVSVREQDRHLTESVEVCQWEIVGYCGFHDDDGANASERVFGALVEAIRDLFRADGTVSGTVHQTSLAFGGSSLGDSGIQLQQLQPVMFADVLCHQARLSLATVRYISYEAGPSG